MPDNAPLFLQLHRPAVDDRPDLIERLAQSWDTGASEPPAGSGDQSRTLFEEPRPLWLQLADVITHDAGFILLIGAICGLITGLTIGVLQQ
jgi:hypothetical protein